MAVMDRIFLIYDNLLFLRYSVNCSGSGKLRGVGCSLMMVERFMEALAMRKNIFLSVCLCIHCPVPLTRQEGNK